MEMKIHKIKGLLAAFAAFLLLASYAAFNYFFYSKGVKLNEMYFLGSGISISILTFLLSTFFNYKMVKLSLVYCSFFYAFLVLLYCWSWLTLNHAYIYIKCSLFLGLITGIAYAVFSNFTNRHNAGS